MIIDWSCPGVCILHLKCSPWQAPTKGSGYLKVKMFSQNSRIIGLTHWHKYWLAPGSRLEGDLNNLQSSVYSWELNAPTVDTVVFIKKKKSS
jgi:hypothetical protein